MTDPQAGSGRELDPAGIEAAAKAAYALGDHLHPWNQASEDMHTEYFMAVALAVSPKADPTNEMWGSLRRELDSVAEERDAVEAQLLAALEAERVAHAETRGKLAEAYEHDRQITEAWTPTLRIGVERTIAAEAALEASEVRRDRYQRALESVRDGGHEASAARKAVNALEDDADL